MQYKNGKDVLPVYLLEELQKYAEGEIIYIPRKAKARAGWGELSGARLLMDERNQEIYLMYRRGFPIEELMEKYHLSEDSIRKIVLKVKTQDCDTR